MYMSAPKRQPSSMTATPLPNPPTSGPSFSGEPPGSDQPSWQPAPATAPETARPHLRRSTTNKVLGGVCGGLAEYTDSDPLLWRVAFVALAVMGAGIFIYPLMWLLVPAAVPSDSRIAGLHQTLREGRSPRS
jgi:phage shock protein PspC (stress-responsive transcriptional regulator)